MLPKSFSDGMQIIKEIEKYNHQAYFVGGCIRDMLLKREIKDVDIATSAKPELIQSIFPKVIPVGIEHGTVIVRYDKVSYEVTTFRIDGNYSDQRHPDSVQFIDKIDDDLKRRDFTINALAMDRTGQIIDLFAGKKDIQNKIIRTVGKGQDRFTEDPLRMIRALRFSSQLGFDIDPETLVCLKKLRNLIETIAVERITNEFEKFFAGAFIHKGLIYLNETKVYEYLPILKDHPTLIEKLPQITHPLDSFAEVIALLHHIEPRISVSSWIKEWKCSNKIKKETIDLVNSIKYYAENGLDEWLVYELPSILFSGFIRLINTIYTDKRIQLQSVIELNESLAIQSRQDLAINGNDLIQLFPHAKRGRWIHQTLRILENRVVYKKTLNNKSDLKEWILCNPPVIN